MLEKNLERLAGIQEKHALPVLAILLCFTLFMGYYAVQIQTDASFDTMYPADSNKIRLQNLVSSEFGSTETFFALAIIDNKIAEKSGVKDIRDPKVIASLHAVGEALKEEPTVDQVFSLASVLEEQYGFLPSTLEESKEMINGLKVDKSFLLSNDFTAANVIISVDIQNKPGSLEKAELVIGEKIKNAERPTGVSLTLTGQPVMLNRIMHLLINDNLLTVGIALLFIFIILTSFFRSPKFAIVAIQPVILTLIWLAGTLRLMDIRITMMTAAVGAMMVGMGIDYSIHMTHTFWDRAKKGYKDATKKTVKSVGSALVASACTTAAGFLAMMLGVSPSSKVQGFVLAVGIMYAFLATVLVLPPLLTLQRKLTFSKLDTAVFRIREGKKKTHTLGPVQKMLRAFGKFQATYPKTILGGAVVFTILLFPGMSLVYMDTDSANWIPDDDPVIEAFSDVGNYFGGTERLNLLVMIDKENLEREEAAILDVRDPSVLKKVAQLDGALEKLDYISFVSSPTDDIKAQAGYIPNSVEEVKNVLEKNPVLLQNFNEDFSIIRMSITADNLMDPKTKQNEPIYYEIVHEIETIGFPDGVKVVPQGGIAEFVELNQYLGSDMGKTTGIGFLFVILIATLFYGSLTVGLLSFFPIIFSMLWAVSLMGYSGLPFTVLTSGMLAIVMGMGIDFSIHLIHKTKESLKEGKAIDQAIPIAISSTGEAIFFATVTTVSGFLSLVLASLLVTQRLGLTLALAISMSFLACMTIVPAVLTIEHNIRQGRQRRKKVHSM